MFLLGLIQGGEGAFFSKNQVKAVSEDRLSDSAVSKICPTDLSWLSPGGYQQGFRIMLLFKRNGMRDLEKLPRVLKQPCSDTLQWVVHIQS